MRKIAHISKIVLTICTLFVATGIISVAQADIDRGISIAGKVSTLGLGAELKYPFREKFDGRLVFNKYDKSYGETRAGEAYTGSLKLKTVGLIGDWHPTGNGFQLSLGVFSNGNKLRAGTTGANYEYNNQQYTGRANLLLDFKSLAPYLGLGWSSQKKHGLSVGFEVGVLFQGAPRLSGSGTATNGNNTCDFTVTTDGVATVTGANQTCAVNGNQNVIQATFKDDIEAEHRELRDALNAFKLYPVLSLGIQYRF